LGSRKTDGKLNSSHGLDFGHNPINCQCEKLFEMELGKHLPAAEILIPDAFDFAGEDLVK
jgi:hypothetical protein